MNLINQKYAIQCENSNQTNTENASNQCHILPIHKNIQLKLNNFLHLNKIPHIIFHGPSGTGKRTIVFDFLKKIYKNDNYKIKTNVMYVNCSHFKGIKFIREELKFFAKINIQSNSGINFKTIILLNADYLTIDAQSALRRCIELYSYNTRFFIIVENKHKLLNPILSRFCEIYIPEYIVDNKVINLYQYNLLKKYNFTEYKENKYQLVKRLIDPFVNNPELHLTHAHLIDTSNEFYENGLSTLDLISFVEKSNIWEEECVSNIQMSFYKVKSEFKFEKLLLLYMLDCICFRSNNKK